MENKSNLSYTDNYISNIFVNYLDQEKSLSSNTSYFTDKYHILELQVELSLNTLHLQADSFAKYMDEKNFYFVRRIANTKNFYRTMYELYIYSYYKSLYLGFYSSQLNSKSDYGLAFFGHGYLYHLLSSERNVTSNNYGGYNIGYRFINYYKRDLILTTLKSYFKFLDGLTRIDPFGCSFEISPLYERLLSEIQNITTFGGKFSDDEFSTNKSKNNPVVSKVSTVSNDYYEGQNVQVRSLNDNVYSDIFGFKTNAIFNAFYSEGAKGFYYVKHSKQDMLFNRNYFLSRANLISGSFVSDGDLDFNSNIYHYKSFKDENNLNKEHLHMISSDVFAITGIRPRSVGNDTTFVSNTYFELTEEIKSLVSNIINNVSEDGVMSFVKSINSEIFDYVEELLGESTSKEQSSN